ncbi:DUF6677 family protein, partial [Thermodesulfobacteriota bacterium]
LFRAEKNLVRPVWDLLFMGIPFPFGIAGVIFVFVLNAALARKEKLRAARRCNVCGKPICKRCQRHITTEIMCFQCMNFIKKKEQLSFKLKEEKILQIRNYVGKYRRVGTLLSRLLPGAGHLWKGKTTRGSVLMMIFFVFFLKGIAVLLLEGPWQFVLSSKIADLVPLLAFLAVFWIVVVIDALRQRSKEVDDNIALKNIAIDI